MNKKKIFIIVGGSQSHVPFVKAAKKLNYKVVIFDKNSLCPAKKFCDEFYQISILDKKKIILKCLEISKKSNLRGIMTYSASTETLAAVSEACDKLKLPSVSKECVKKVSNKRLMKKCFEKNEISTSEWILTKKINQGITFLKKFNKIIIKPYLNSRGSKGVYICDTKNILLKYFLQKKSKLQNSKVILENYYKGQEYSIDGYVFRNKPIVLSISKKFNLGEENNFIMKGFSKNSFYKRNKKVKDLEKVAFKTVNSLEINNSFFSIDVIIDKFKIIVLECGVQLDCKIDRMLYFLGLDVYSLFVKIVSNVRPQFPKLISNKSAVLVFIFSKKKGQLLNTKVYRKKNALVEWNVKKGDIVYEPKSISDTLGWVILKGSDCRSMFKKALAISNQKLYGIKS